MMIVLRIFSSILSVVSGEGSSLLVRLRLLQLMSMQ